MYWPNLQHMLKSNTAENLPTLSQNICCGRDVTEHLAEGTCTNIMLINTQLIHTKMHDQTTRLL